MGQESFYLPAPYQGVSQAPPQTRRNDQAEALVDCMVQIPQGWASRPPFTWTGRLTDHPGHTNGAFERVERDGGADVFLTLTNEVGVIVPRVYPVASFPGEVASEVVTVTADAHTYLNFGNPDPAADLGVLTVEDFTFIWNRKKLTANTTDRSGTRSPEAMVWCRVAAYARTFTVTVTPDGGTPVTASLHTPDGTAATDGPYVGTDVIAASLVSGTYAGATIHGGTISGNLAGLSSQGFTVSVEGAVIYLQRTSGGDFDVIVHDDLGGTALTSIKDKAQSFSDLPKVAVDGFTVRIVQSGGTDADDYYVKYEATAGTGTGVWVETIAPNALFGLDPKSMPVGLVNDGGWQLKVLDWKLRTTGDSLLVPDPDFIGQAIQDLSFWRNRLAIIAGEGCTLGSSEDPLRFYPRTLATVLDTDPIGLINPFPSRSTFRYAIPFDTKLVLFGDICQAQITAGDTAKPGGTRIDTMTTYVFSNQGASFSQPARPQGSNGKVYFVAPRGRDWSSVFELKVDNIINVTDAEDLSTAVPRYFPSGINRVANCPINFLMAYGVSGQSELTMHLFRYANSERVQNAPFKWNLPTGFTLGGCLFQSTQLYVLGVADGEAHLLLADTSPNLIDDGSTRLLTSLDLRVTDETAEVTYDAGTGLTSVVLPWPLTADPQVIVRNPGGPGGIIYGTDSLPVIPEGSVIPVQSYDAGTRTVILAGDYSITPMWFGIPYSAQWLLSKLYAQGQPGEPIHSGRCSIRRMKADLSGTGYLRAEVTARGRDTRSYEFTGYTLDDPNSQLDISPDAGGVFSFAVMTENEQCQVRLVADSHFQASIQGLEWTAEINPKSQRVGG